MRLRPLSIAPRVFTLLAVAFAQPARCDGADPQPTDGKTADVLRFRRVYAPADRVKQWPLGNVKYMPIEPAEFERLLAIARTKTTKLPPSVAARAVTAEYRARLVDEQLIVGDASLQVVHSADEPALLPLDPCGLAVGKWAVGEQAGAEPKKATVGLGRDGKLHALVDHSGRLDFDWSLAGRRQRPGKVDFQFELPPCPVNRLVLDAPKEMAVEVDHGAVSVADATEQGLRRWQIELGGHHRFRLQVVPADGAGERRQLTLVRESVLYDFSLRGVEVSTQLTLDPRNEPLRQITLAVDGELALVSCQYADKPLPWSVASPPGSPVTRVVLALPEPSEGKPSVLRLKALAPLTTGRPWRLPRIRPQGMFWEEGAATLMVPAPLVVQRLVPVGGRQSGTGPLSAPRVGESLKFRYFKPEATVELLLAGRRDRVQLASGTAIELSGRGMTARVVADFSITDGLRFSLEADAARRWLIDSVESIPPEAMEDWTVHRQRGKPKLTVRLAQPLAPDRPVRLVVTARRLQSPLDRTLAVGELVPLRFNGPEESRLLVAVRTAGPYQLTLSGTERLKRLDSRNLDAADMARFAELPRGLLFEDDAGAAELKVGLQRQRPRYAGTIRVEAIVGQRTVQENYVLSCRPESARVEQVVVRFSRHRDVPVGWRLVGAEDEEQLTPRRLRDDEQIAAGWEPAEEAWELTLRRPRSEPFSIRAARHLDLDDEKPLPVSLASLPLASSQRATLVVRSVAGKVVRITNSRLQPIPAEMVPPDRCQTTCGRYRYDPASDVLGAPDPAVTICTSRDLTRPAWVWHCQLESWYEADGRAQHLATYRLQNCGAGRVRLMLPDEVGLKDLCDAWVDGNRVDWHQASNGVEIDLPRDEKLPTQEGLPPYKRFPTVTLHFATPPARLGIVGSLKPCLPQIEPVLSRHWTVWLPPGYEASDAEPRWQGSMTPQLSWSQRLFGPLGRPTGKMPFDLLAGEHSSLVPGGRSARPPAVRRAEQLLQALGDLQRGGVDWAGLLGHPSLDALHLTVLVDRGAVARLGLTPQAVIRPAAGEDSTACGVDLLKTAGLALLVHREALLLTSQAEAALLHARLEPLGRQVLWRVRSGFLAEQMQQAAAGKPHRSLVPAETWAREPTEPKVLWTQAEATGHQPADAYGWTAYHLEIPELTSDAAPARLRFVHRQTMRLLGSVAFLLVVALGWWAAGNRPDVLASLAGVFAFVALVLPEAYAPVASGAVLGALFCLGWGLVRGRRRTRPSSVQEGRKQETASTVSAATRLSIVAFAAATLGGLCAVARGQEDQQAPPVRPPVYRVFIPTDENGQPTGGKYQVPEQLYQLLYQLKAATAKQAQGWLISAATYRAVLSRQSAPGGLGIEELKAVFDLQVLGDMARLRIPLRREEVSLLPDGAVLDGQPIRPEWEADGSGLAFEVVETGHYRLELSLQPSMRGGDGPAGFDLAIPRLATSRLELIIPPDAPRIDLPSAAGAVRLEKQPPRIVAELGPSGRLSVRWPRGAGPGATGPTLDVEELLWLKVQPGSVLLDAKFKLKAAEGQVSRLQLATDPRLRLERAELDGLPLDKPETVRGQPQTITLKPPRPLSQTAVVDATFLLKDSSGVGNLRLPQLRLLDATPARRWLAVSVDPALNVEQAADQLEAVAVPDFLAAWGEAASQPGFAYRLGESEADWSISTYPREPVTSVQQRLVLSFEREVARLRFDAELVTTDGYNFQYRLDAPSALRIEHVSLEQQGVQRAVRWSKDAAGSTVTVFLSGPVDGRQELSVRGWLPIRVRKKLPLPVLKIHGSQLQSSTIQLFRRPSVLVEVERANGLVEVQDSTVEPSDPELGRLVGEFQAEAEKPIKATLLLQPNRPKVRAEQVTRLRWDGRSWIASIDCRIRVTEGVVDHLRIDAPSQFHGPYTVDPPASLKVVEKPGQPRHLVMRPPAAIEDAYQFSVAGPLKLAPGQRVPRIELADVERAAGMLVLPKQTQGQPIDWETEQLQKSEEARLPEGFADPSPPGAFAVYRVVGEPYRAILRPADRARNLAHVRLADVHLAWKTDGTCHGVATFDLEPGRPSQVPLWLPSGYHLVQVKVAGVPTVPDPVRAAAWRVSLGPKVLPQRIEVVFTGILSDLDDGPRFEAPTLGELPVDKTLWTIVGPSAFEPGRPQGTDAVAPWDHELARLQNAAALIESASLIPTEDPQETFRWYWPWARRLAGARTALRRQLARTVPTEQARPLRSQLRAIDRRQAQIAERLGMTKAYQELMHYGVSVADEPVALLNWSLDRPQPAARCSLPERSDAVTLTYRRAAGGRLPRRLVAAAGLAVLALLMVLGLRRGILAESFKRWPHAVGVAAGLAWWLWLSPSILGWAIVLVSLLACLRSGWKYLRPAPGSTVISVRSVQR